MFRHLALTAGVLLAAHGVRADEGRKAAPHEDAGGHFFTYQAPVGKLLLRCVTQRPKDFGWFTALPRAEQDRLVADLDRYKVVIRDAVKPKAARAGSAPAWQFAHERVSRVAVEPPPDGKCTRSLTVKPVITNTRTRAAGTSDEKEVFLQFKWEAKKGQALRVLPLVTAEKVAWGASLKYSAAPAKKPADKKGDR